MKGLMLALIATLGIARVHFEIPGTVADLEESSVIVATSGGLVRVPKGVIRSKNLRPGEKVSIPVDGKTKLEVIKSPVTRRGPAVKP